MAKHLDIKKIVDNAKGKGCFDTNDLGGVSLNMDQFKELHLLLQKKKIPLCRSQTEEKSDKLLASGEARGIINNLRTGVPAGRYITAYSVGQDKLITSFYQDLEAVGELNSRVRFLNGDYGRGKTHALRLLREKAFRSDFVVSEVTLSPEDCPLHDFMAVYRQIMNGIRTKENPNSPAIENILQRWLNNMRARRPEEVKRIVYEHLPPAIKGVLATYYDAQNFLRNNAHKRQMTLKYLYGDRLYARDKKSLSLTHEINEDTALMMLGQIAHLVRYIGYKGICIFFDEAESTHSFAYYGHRDRAFQNLRRITQESKNFHHCYFLYATTPSFFNNYPDYNDIIEIEVLELELLSQEQRRKLCSLICDIYSRAYDWKVPAKTKEVLGHIEATLRQQNAEIGDLVRAVVAALGELRRKA